MKLKSEEIQKIKDILMAAFEVKTYEDIVDQKQRLWLYLPSDLFIYREGEEISYSYSYLHESRVDVIASYKRGDYDMSGDWQAAWESDVMQGDDPKQAANLCLDNLIDELLEVL